MTSTCELLRAEVKAADKRITDLEAEAREREERIKVIMGTLGRVAAENELLEKEWVNAEKKIRDLRIQYEAKEGKQMDPNDESVISKPNYINELKEYISNLESELKRIKDTEIDLDRLHTENAGLRKALNRIVKFKPTHFPGDQWTQELIDVVAIAETVLEVKKDG